MNNISLANRVYGLATALLLLLAVLAATGYTAISAMAVNTAQLARVSSLGTEVAVAERYFSGARARYRAYVSSGKADDLKLFQDETEQVQTRIGNVLARTVDPGRKALGEQVAKAVKDLTSDGLDIFAEYAKLATAGGQLRDQAGQPPAAGDKSANEAASGVRQAVLAVAFADSKPDAGTLAFAAAAADSLSGLSLSDSDKRLQKGVQDNLAAIKAFLAKDEAQLRKLDAARQVFIDLRTRFTARADEVAADVAQGGDYYTKLMVALAVAALALGTVIAVLIARSITGPVNKMTFALTRLATGDGAVDIPGIGTSNEIGKMADAANVFKMNAGKIANMMKAEGTTLEIGDVIGKAAAGDLTARVDLAGKAGFLLDIGKQVNLLLDASHSAFRDFGDKARGTALSVNEAGLAIGQIADGARVQNRSLSQVAAAVAESLLAINDVSSNTRTAGEKADATAKLVENGIVSVEHLAEIVDRIAANSRKINQITQVISQIANRTHILSLNAAIEAARAGEHGKGFVVVAQEVGKLAESAGQNAGQIAEIVEQAAADTQAGKAATESVRAAMKGISGESRTTTRMIHASASAIEQQKASMAQIDGTVGELKSIATSNAAAGEEITATMVQLSRLADDMRRRVDAFKMA